MCKLIAIIDDESEMEFIYALMFEELIQKEQLQVQFFSDARLFEQWFKSHRPDLIMSDISMPYLSGPELGLRIRQKDHQIITYFVSGHEERDYRQSMDELGICRFLPKPLDPEALLEIIKSDLKLKG